MTAAEKGAKKAGGAAPVRGRIGEYDIGTKENPVDAIGRP